MTGTPLSLLKRARVYALKSGDIVVLETPDKLSQATLARVSDDAVRIFRPAKVVVLEGGMTIRVLRPAAQEQSHGT